MSRLCWVRFINWRRLVRGRMCWLLMIWKAKITVLVLVVVLCSHRIIIVTISIVIHNVEMSTFVHWYHYNMRIRYSFHICHWNNSIISILNRFHFCYFWSCIVLWISTVMKKILVEVRGKKKKKRIVGLVLMKVEIERGNKVGWMKNRNILIRLID